MKPNQFRLKSERQNKTHNTGQEQNIRRMNQIFDIEKKKLTSAMAPETKSLFEELLNNNIDLNDNFGMEHPMRDPMALRAAQQTILHQMSSQISTQNQYLPQQVEHTNYALIFLNPEKTLIECQRAFMKFYSECQLYIEKDIVPDAEKLKQLVSCQYYPPIKRYNELLQLIKQLPQLQQQIDLELPSSTYYFEKPQIELFDMIQFLNNQIARVVSQQEWKPTPEILINNQNIIDRQEQLAQSFLEQYFKSEFTADEMPQFHCDRLIIKTGDCGGYRIVLMQQILTIKDELKVVFQFQKWSQAAQNIEQLRQKVLFQAPRNFNFQVQLLERKITTGYDLIQNLLISYVGIVYQCQLDDSLSPFTKNGKFWKLRERYMTFISGCTQQTVTVIVLDQQVQLNKVMSLVVREPRIRIEDSEWEREEK